MEKVRVRHVIKPGKIESRNDMDLPYEVDSSNRELLSVILEKKLESSLNELEKALKKTSVNLDD